METVPRHNNRRSSLVLQPEQPASEVISHNGDGRAEHRFQLLLESAHIIPWEADARSSQFTFVGMPAEEVLGYPVSDWYTPGFWSAHLHPEDRQRAIAESARLSQSEDTFEIEYRMIAQDGHPVWLHSLVLVEREDGAPLTMFGFSIDVSRSRQAEVALRDVSARLINAQEEERSRVARE